jgi:hypothetical protein
MPKRAPALTRYQVFALIDQERAYQDSLPSSRTDGKDKTVGDYLTMLRGYLTKAEAAWNDNAGVVPALDIIRKIGGISVRCMEEHGAPSRDGQTPKLEVKSTSSKGIGIATQI